MGAEAKSKDATAVAAAEGGDGAAGGKVNIWESILENTRSKSTLKFSPKTLLVVGDERAGKTALLCRLQKTEEPTTKGIALDYSYLDVNGQGDDADEVVSRINVWEMDGDADYKEMAQFAINKDTFEGSMGVICVPFSEPWNLLTSLDEWYGVLRTFVEEVLTETLPAEQLEQWRRAHARAWLSYKEYKPSDDPAGDAAAAAAVTPSKKKKKKEKKEKKEKKDAEEGADGDAAAGDQDEAAAAAAAADAAAAAAAALADDDDDDEDVELPDHVLKHNIGLPLVVVCTKLDRMGELEHELGYKDTQYDFIQSHVRKWCLEHGAALLYTSAKENKNIELLTDYVEHRLYDFPLLHAPQLLEKGELFVPMGWDNMTAIHSTSGDIAVTEPYETVITKPAAKKSTTAEEFEVEAADEQTFLAAQKAALDAGGHVSKVSNEKMRVPFSDEDRTSTSSAAVGAGKSSKAAGGGAGGGAGGKGQPNEEALVSFFHSLLNKGGGAGGKAGGAKGKSSSSKSKVKKSSSSKVKKAAK